MDAFSYRPSTARALTGEQSSNLASELARMVVGIIVDGCLAGFQSIILL